MVMTIQDIRFGRPQARKYETDYRGMLAYTNIKKPDKMYINQNLGFSRPKQMVQEITHEEGHQALYRAGGMKATHALDKYMPLYSAVEKSVRWTRCTNCGERAIHTHGQHPCCGSLTCHSILGTRHSIFGESGASFGIDFRGFEW